MEHNNNLISVHFENSAFEGFSPGFAPDGCTMGGLLALLSTSLKVKGLTQLKNWSLSVTKMFHRPEETKKNFILSANRLIGRYVHMSMLLILKH